MGEDNLIIKVLELAGDSKDTLESVGFKALVARELEISPSKAGVVVDAALLFSTVMQEKAMSRLVIRPYCVQSRKFYPSGDHWAVCVEREGVDFDNSEIVGVVHKLDDSEEVRERVMQVLTYESDKRGIPVRHPIRWSGAGRRR